MNHNQPVAAPVVKLAEPVPEPKPVADKLYTFKLLKGTNFPEKVKVIDVDADGNWQPMRDAIEGEYGAHSKIQPGVIVAVNAVWAKRFDAHAIGKRIEEYV